MHCEWVLALNEIDSLESPLGMTGISVSHFFVWSSGVFVSHFLVSGDCRLEMSSSYSTASSKIARTHAHVEITHLPTRCIIRAWEAWDCTQVLSRFWWSWEVGKYVMSAWARVLAFIPWPVRNIKQPCRNCTFPHTPFLHELRLGHGIKHSNLPIVYNVMNPAWNIKFGNLKMKYVSLLTNQWACYIHNECQ